MKTVFTVACENRKSLERTDGSQGMKSCIDKVVSVNMNWLEMSCLINVCVLPS